MHYKITSSIILAPQYRRGVASRWPPQTAAARNAPDGLFPGLITNVTTEITEISEL